MSHWDGGGRNYTPFNESNANIAATKLLYLITKKEVKCRA